MALGKHAALALSVLLLVEGVAAQFACGQSAALPPRTRTVENGLAAARSKNQRLTPTEGANAELVIRQALVATARAQEVIVGNLANAHTPGYKRQTVTFATTFETASPSLEQGLKVTELESACRMGAVLAPSHTDMSRGKLRRTGRSLDLAIDGDGFFMVERADAQAKGMCCTRWGSLALDSHRQLVLRGQDHDWIITPTINVPAGASKIEIGTDGDVTVSEGVTAANQKGDDNRLHIGMMFLVCFRSDCEFTPCGDNVFLARADRHGGASPGHGGLGYLKVGYLEDSNVDPERELDELGKLQRHAEALENAARLLHLGNCLRPGAGEQPAKPAAR